MKDAEPKNVSIAVYQWLDSDFRHVGPDQWFEGFRRFRNRFITIESTLRCPFEFSRYGEYLMKHLRCVTDVGSAEARRSKRS